MKLTIDELKEKIMTSVLVNEDEITILGKHNLIFRTDTQSGGIIIKIAFNEINHSIQSRLNEQDLQKLQKAILFYLNNGEDFTTEV